MRITVDIKDELLPVFQNMTKGFGNDIKIHVQYPPESSLSKYDFTNFIADQKRLPDERYPYGVGYNFNYTFTNLKEMNYVYHSLNFLREYFRNNINDIRLISSKSDVEETEFYSLIMNNIKHWDMFYEAFARAVRENQRLI